MNFFNRLALFNKMFIFIYFLFNALLLLSLRFYETGHTVMEAILSVFDPISAE